MKFLPLLVACFYLGGISAQISFKLSVVNTNCVANGGAASVVLDTGKVQSVLYQWSTGGNGSSISNLAAGNYSVTVFNNAKTDSSVKSFVVNNAATILVSTLPQDTICAGTTAVLEASALPAGGTFTWSGGDLSAARTKDSIHVQPKAEQTYTVTYNSSTCSGSTTVKVVASPVKAQIAGVAQPSCGLANGSITGAGSAFKATFTWWKDGQPFGANASILSNLKAGNYTFAIYDGVTGCSDTIKNIVLADNTTYASLTALATTPDSCLVAQGTAALTVTGGSGNYTFKWSHSNTVTGSSASKLAKGNYRVTVSDGVCTPFDTAITIAGPDSGIAAVTSVVNDNCSKATGSATVVASGGTVPYSYWWSNGGTLATANNLLGGNNYDVTITDVLGCSVFTSVFVGDIAAPALVFFPFDSLCPNASNGKLQLKASGGLPPYQYQWQHNTALTASIATNLAPGTYSATVTDAGNCTAVAQVTIAAFDNPQIDLGNDTSILKGEIATLQLKTTLPITGVKWSPFTQSAENQVTAYTKPDSTTTYTVLVSYGNNGCLLSDTITIQVLNEAAEVIVPNIFTPNGDGVNDYFYVSSKAIKQFNVKVFDRWGNNVFESFDADFKWNGHNMADGTELPNGVFTYVIEFVALNNNKRELLKGSITLLR